MKTFFIIILALTAIYVVYNVTGSIKQAMTVATGWAVYEALNTIYDGILWPVAQGIWAEASLPFLFLGALVMNFLVLHFYQKSGQDWMGVSALEKIKEKSDEMTAFVMGHPNLLYKWLAYIPTMVFASVMYLLKKNDITAYVLLSGYDSFLCTAFLRKGRPGKLEKKDYYIFISSTVISCVIWSGIVQIGLEIFKKIF